MVCILLIKIQIKYSLSIKSIFENYFHSSHCSVLILFNPSTQYIHTTTASSSHKTFIGFLILYRHNYWSSTYLACKYQAKQDCDCKLTVAEKDYVEQIWISWMLQKEPKTQISRTINQFEKHWMCSLQIPDTIIKNYNIKRSSSMRIYVLHQFIWNSFRKRFYAIGWVFDDTY